MLEWRLKALQYWFKMEREQGEPSGPTSSSVHRLPEHRLLLAPKQKPSLDSLNQVDPELLKTYAKLGIPIDEQKRLSNVAVDAVFDSVSVATTFKDKLAEMASSSARSLRRCKSIPTSSRSTWAQSCRTPTISTRRSMPRSSPTARLYMYRRACVAPWSFDVLPHQRRGDGPVRAHPDHRRRRRPGELPRGLHRAHSRHQSVHAAVVELIALDNAQIKYSTCRTGTRDKEGRGGIFNSLPSAASAWAATRRSRGRKSRPAPRSPGSTPAASFRATTRGRVLLGALTNNRQQADTGTKMIPSARTALHHRVQGISAGSAKHISRPGQDHEGATGAATTRSAIRCSSATSAARTPSRILSAQRLGAHGARSVDFEDWRRSALLSAPARHQDRRRGFHDRERLLNRLQGAAMDSP